MVLSSLFAGWCESSKQSISLLGETCKSTREIGETCSPILKEAQPRPSRESDTERRRASQSVKKEQTINSKTCNVQSC